MSLPYYTNLLSLSSRLIDDLNILQSFVSLVVFLSSLFYCIICLNRKLKGVTYQHLAPDSVVCVIYAAIQSWTWIIRCGALCSYGYSFGSKVYDLYIFVYLRQTFDTFMMLIEINLTYIKLQSFSNEQNRKTYIPLYAKFIMFYIYSAAVCVPCNLLPRLLFPGSYYGISLIGYLITSNNSNHSYLNLNASDLRPLYQVLSLNKESDFMKWDLIAGFLAGIGPLFLYFVLQVVLFFKLRAFLAQKRRTLGPARDKEIEKKEIKSTWRVIVLGINCCIGYFPNKLANNFLLYALTSQQWSLYIPFSNMLIWVSNGLKLFINLAFDQEFRMVFKKTFRLSTNKSVSSSTYATSSTRIASKI